ncbi:single-strand DNA-binding protein [Actinomyces denticolens]|uniref:Single-stranded DNA-binding protein n=1 Tax=Actinomyces denticolens TaxID=52767 RepID=A0ABY1IG63_9ACTO|nr:single-stranded DNA-binding protein [Actinomyces denticolens]SHJ12966.1 single-strand DNA-binding protein [Actinomyces denticolens]
MTGEPTTTIIGNLTADPEMRYTASGAAVASFTIASTPRAFNRQTNQWQDGQTLFMRCQVWRDAAQNTAASLTKGTRVIATGRLQQRSYTDREGAQRTVIEMQVDEIGPSLRYSTTQITRRADGPGSQASPGAPWEPQAPAEPDHDGWEQ